MFVFKDASLSHLSKIKAAAFCYLGVSPSFYFSEEPAPGISLDVYF
jgi:hypothetical protein